MSRILKSLLAFSAAGLVGPAIWLAAWPPARLADVLPRPVWFFYTHLVEMLWPVSMMGPWIGLPANLVLFIALGLTVGWLARTRTRLAITYAVITVLVFLMALWQAGFALARVDGFALAVALLLYAIPFWVMIRGSVTPRSA
jgi:hypothetical protein